MLKWLESKRLADCTDYAKGYNDALKDVAEHIAGGAWEEVAPKGRFGTAKYRCTKCGCESYDRTKYCPNCGSVMF